MAREVIMRFNGFSREGNEPILESVGELVRCKDCRLNRTESCPMTVSYTDNVKHWIYCGQMGFCSFGEKKRGTRGEHNKYNRRGKRTSYKNGHSIQNI